MDCSMPGFPVLHHLPELAQTHFHWVSDAISSCVVPFSSCLQSFPPSGSFIMSWPFASGGQSIGASASAQLKLCNSVYLMAGAIFFRVLKARLGGGQAEALPKDLFDLERCFPKDCASREDLAITRNNSQPGPFINIVYYCWNQLIWHEGLPRESFLLLRIFFFFFFSSSFFFFFTNFHERFPPTFHLRINLLLTYLKLVVILPYVNKCEPCPLKSIW